MTPERRPLVDPNLSQALDDLRIYGAIDRKWAIEQIIVQGLSTKTVEEAKTSIRQVIESKK